MFRQQICRPPPTLVVANSIPKIPYAKYRVCEEELQTSVHSILAPKMHRVFEVDGGLEASLPHSLDQLKQTEKCNQLDGVELETFEGTGEED